MELRQLATFVAVAEEGSFTRASGRLHIVQSAVSANVRNLEGELDARLFDRSTHKVELTEAGRALLPEARATLAAATVARDAVDAVRGGVRGTVLLGTMQSHGMHAIDVPGVVADFRAEHPAVEVHIRAAAGGSQEMALQVRDGTVDLAFVAIPGGELASLEVTPLAREPILIVAPAGHPLTKRKTTELAALTDQTLAEFPHGWGIRTANDRAFAAAGLTRTITYEINDTASLIGFIRHGLAVGIIPASFVDAPRGLAFVPIRDHPVEFVTAIATPSHRRLTAAAQALLATIKRHASVDAHPAPHR
jgi:DNA-binding transcriptional LysR family regulator